MLGHEDFSVGGHDLVGGFVSIVWADWADAAQQEKIMNLLYWRSSRG